MNSPYHHSPGHPTRISHPAEELLGTDVRRGETVTYVDPAGNYTHERPESGGYIVPAGLAAKAARDAEAKERDPQPTIVDALAEDAAPPEFPDGCPEFYPLYELGFRQRAEAFDLFAVIQETSAKMPKKGAQLTPAQAADMYRMLDKLDEFLAFVAKDPEVYKAWPGRHQDAVFGQAWAAYQARLQPGEAGRSSN